MKREDKRTIGLVILLTVVVIITAAVATFVVAKYLKTADLTNNFTPAAPKTPEVEEEFKENDYKLKENVYFEVGETNYPVYVRAKIVITWKDEDGNVYYTVPTVATPIYEDEPTDPDNPEIIGYNGDYLIDLNLDDWLLAEDGFYYYVGSDGKLKSVASGGKTTNLINTCEWINKDNAPDGYILSVEVIVQTVQAVGTTDEVDGETVVDAWENAWGQFKAAESEAEPDAVEP